MSDLSQHPNVRIYYFYCTCHPSINEIPLKVTGARMFLMASPSLQLAHFFVGLFVFVSGAGLSYWGTKKAPGRQFNRLDILDLGQFLGSFLGDFLSRQDTGLFIRSAYRLG